jgi:aminoglycoside phosphotransferase (APT) family kinase protein
MDICGRIKIILNDRYGIDASAVEPRAGGWSARAFFVEDQAQKYFLKAYDKKRPSSAPWIAAMDRYIPLVQWLHENTALSGNTADTVYTQTGECKCEDGAFVYLLSDYIEGVTLGGTPLSSGQTEELAKILGTLHASTPLVPAELLSLQMTEDFKIPFCDSLQFFLQNHLIEKADALRETMGPYEASLLAVMERMRDLSASLKGNPRQYVLCHADAHGWNLMQGERLMLIDWECLKLAPREQDLVLQVMGPSAPHFFREYKKFADYEKSGLETFEYYWLKRLLEDIWEWVKDLRVDGLVKPEEHTLGLLHSALCDCANLDVFRSALQASFR